MLILVVGASGVGKDTLINGAKAALSSDERVVFAEREISRPLGTGAEGQISMDHAEFSVRDRAGRYAFAWDAHGIDYGVPKEIEVDLAAGRSVVVSASRAVLDVARERYGPVRIVSITADPSTVAERLGARGRDDRTPTVRRLEAEDTEIAGDDVVTLFNNGTPSEGVAKLVQAIVSPLTDDPFVDLQALAADALAALERVSPQPAAEHHDRGIGHNQPPPDSALTSADYEAVRATLSELRDQRAEAYGVGRRAEVLRILRQGTDQIQRWYAERAKLIREGFYRQIGANLALTVGGLALWVIVDAKLQVLLDALARIWRGS
jgi:ribose 1,5-bisphosphokinase